ncbi:zinc transporter ZIP6-like [Python bivittatus]|uniref:Zinc transporter ZIP6 n=1 Tax=Python bivittatus TaxID=176946 RepID=A0A9F5IR22_PYTBI|nr:zinc transporter ZIP6-like [Python bivittatus]XP_025019952.1 zinc transporter ZIP6-like [Python bivittatus]XP_025019953.1 zinc transporter ZIP6-like [Python bivittatus]
MANKLYISFLHLLSTFLFCHASYPSLEPTVSQTTEKLIPEKAASINISVALCRQRHHLQELFSRYGENNTLNIEGFKKLLHNIGIEKVKRISLDHNHYHHHHNHATLRTNSDKTYCPSDESGSGNKDFLNNPAKDVPGTENMEHHQQESMNNKSTTVAITTSTYTTATEDNSLLQHSETAELSARIGFASPNPNIVLGSSSNCFNASEMMLFHGINTQVSLTATEFSYLCPAIISQIDGRNCIIHATSEKAETAPKTYSLQVAWIGGFISISIISFLSLLGVILVPLMNRVFFKFLLSFLVALAVGTLSGDALLHLLPHSHGNHHHHHEKSLMEHSKDLPFKHLVFQSSEESAYLDSTWKGLTALGGLYFMFLVEHLITLIKQFKDKKKKKKNDDDELEIKKQLSKYDSQLSANEDKIDADDSKFQ